MSFQKVIREKILKTKSLSSLIFDSDGKINYNFSGTVFIESPSSNEIIFNETVKWKNENNLLINSKNVYKWIFCDSGNIKLEHLRFGKNRPVFLVEFLKSGDKLWKSKEPHICNKDFYSSELYLENEDTVLFWNVKGPLNNYSIKTSYSDKYSHHY